MNGYPHFVISRVFKEIKEKQLNQQNIFQKPNEDDKKVHSLILPYNGLKGGHVINIVKKRLNTKLPERGKIQTRSTGRRSSSLFEIKDRAKKEHENDLVYSYLSLNLIINVGTLLFSLITLQERNIIARTNSYII